MLLSAKGVEGTKIEGADDHLGNVADLLFDDETWQVRYLVVDTGKWLPGRQVILHPQEIDRTEWTRGRIHCPRTKQEIEESPPLAEDEPVSRQHESRLSAHFLWSHAGPVGPASVSSVGGVPPTEAEAAGAAAVEETDGDPHLRSADEVVGYHIHATDGDIGHVEDLILDDSEVWKLRYLIVDTRNWLPGRKVLVATGWAKEIRWGAREVQVDLAREIIEKSPEFDPSQPVNRRYEEKLYDYYGRPAYWRD